MAVKIQESKQTMESQNFEIKRLKLEIEKIKISIRRIKIWIYTMDL